jgi:hypothetical protein
MRWSSGSESAQARALHRTTRETLGLQVVVRAAPPPGSTLQSGAWDRVAELPNDVPATDTVGCRYQKLVRSEILEDSVAAGHAGPIMLNVLRSLAGAARSFLRTQRKLALENLALRHQVGVLKRTVGNRRL